MIDVDGVLIHEGLSSQLEPADRVSEHPDNPRRGAVDKITDSVAANGVYKAIVAQRSTGFILSGNHTYRAITEAGARRVPVTWVDVDDEGAKRIMLADNRTSEFGTIDPTDLLAVLNDLTGTEGGLTGSGYADFDMDDLAVELERLTPQAAAQTVDDLDDEVAASDEAGRPYGGSGYDPGGGRVEASRRIIVLDFPLDLFVEMTDALTEICNAENLETNQEAVVYLVRAWHANR